MAASRRDGDCFGPMVAAAAWARGLFGSARRAFRGDGSENNWSVWRHYFGSFVPIDVRSQVLVNGRPEPEA